MKIHLPLLFFCAILFLLSCKKKNEDGSSHSGSGEEILRFEMLAAEKTGVHFNNKLDIDKLKSPLEYINVYNGGGVAIGDINNDGLPDLYFTGNLEDNRLYLNKGNFEFEDITAKAGVACANSWSTGATMFDVNGDGLLDIYVCRAYYDEPGRRENLLFINNGDLTFTERGMEYGLNDAGYSIVAVFFDYDKDGHADLYVGNHPLDRMASFGHHIQNWKNPTLEWSDRLYRNNGDGTFTDVTQKSGILNYGWTLGAVAADLNQDGWTDLFVAVDHTEPDRYYLNNGNGTFTEVSDEKLRHMSHSSMGVDAADINNDGLLDLAVVEMLSTSNFDEKTKMASMNPELFWTFVDQGYHYQYMRNMLHLNMGGGYFSEIGQMAGVHRTNWSWASLLADFDNDGWKDFFVTNGYFREYLDKDHNKKVMDEIAKAEAAGKSKREIIADFGRLAPSTKIENNFFRNNGDLTFTEKGPVVGLNFLGFSSGAAYADLDNDGDLDLVVNNINAPASVYRNQLDGKRNYLRIRLEHPASVCPAGTKVKIETPSGIQYQELLYTRGYQSSVEGVLHFGLNKDIQADRVIVEWLDGKRQEIRNVAANQTLKVDYKDAGTPAAPLHHSGAPLLADISAVSGVNFRHRETPFDDYTKQVLLPHKMSQFGPFTCTGDVNGDGLEDFFVGGGNGQAGVLYLQTPEGKFVRVDIPAFQLDKIADDMGAVFVDVNGDGLLDLYVVSGGNEYPEGHETYRDRLYINTGGGLFQKAINALPDIRISGSCVVPIDFNGDGYMDLFVGGRHAPGRYPSPVGSVLLENQGGKFVDVTAQRAPELKNLGMVADAMATDFDGDGFMDLLIVGEWMPVTVFKQKAGKFVNATAEFGLDKTVGWWNRIAKGDIDGNGDADYILGNLGYNYKYAASPERPFHVFAADFDDNGTFDIALGYYLADDVLYPVRGRQCSSEQVPSIAQKFPTYEQYGKASIFEVYGDKLKSALHYEATHFASSFLINQGGGKYTLQALPNEAQIAPVNAIVFEDFDGDGLPDLLLGGNLFVSEVETGRADAGKGCLLKNMGEGRFKALFPYESGLWIPGDVKDIRPLRLGANGRKAWLVANNDDAMQLLSLKK
jgi:enediyne biosynthesis protein E4